MKESFCRRIVFILFTLVSLWTSTETYASSASPILQDKTLRRISVKDGFYEIYSASDLKDFAKLVNEGKSDACARLCADINMNGVKMDPIGFGGITFRGTFDGQNHLINHLSISCPDNDFVGLFGMVGNGAHIHNFMLSPSCQIEGHAFVGIIGGSNESGSVYLECIGNEGSVVALEQNAGGIIGCNYGSGASYVIRNCYVTGSVKGRLESAAISGWVGDNCTISYCFSTAELSGNNANETFARNGGDLLTSDCYELSGKGGQSYTQKVSAAQVGNGELAAMLNTRQEDVWRQTIGQDSHPMFLEGHTLVAGLDSQISEMEIKDAAGFLEFANRVKYNSFLSATLLSDIDLKGVQIPVIGTESTPYCGTFNGRGHVISNLTISRDGESSVGLFSSVGGGAVLSDFTLDRSCRISGLAFVGLVGSVVGNGTVRMERLGNEGMVVAQNQNAGGLIGCVFSGTVTCKLEDCYVSGLIRGGLESGAISGWLSVSPQLKNCYSSATVSGVEGDKTFYRFSSVGSCVSCYEVNGLGRQDITLKVNADQLATGELTLQLNHNNINEDAVWRQNLGEDRHPVLRRSHEIVKEVDSSISFDSSPLQHRLIINEVQVANIDQFVDPSFNYGGWIEVYNPANIPVELDYLYVSDDAASPFKFQLPGFFGDVPAMGYRNIWFDHNAADGEYGPEAFKQVNFKLDAEGGIIFLSDASGQIISSVNYPPAVSRCSYARRSLDSEEWGMTGTPTPECGNEGVSFSSVRMSSPQVSVDGKIFDSPFRFTVDIPEGATLRYTTDCSTPTMQNGVTSRNGVFSVDPKTSIYRFCLFKDGYLPSEVVTRSFIYRDRTYNLPVISVTTDDANLYGDSLGVYVNGVNGVAGRGVGKSNINMDWERPVNFEYLLPDGTTAINQEATFHVAGGWNRHIYPQRSFKLKAEKQYEGQNSFNYTFFESKPYNKYRMLLIRNGGNDTGAGRCQDAIIQELIQSSGMYVDGQAWQPVQVLFNGGKYYAMMNMREASNKFFASSNYGYDTDEVDVMELVSGSGLTPLTGDMEAFNHLHDLSSRINEPGVYDQVKALLDIDECANYMAAECYLGSWDWLTANNNTKVFRSRNDGRFHFVMYDVESAVDNSYAGMWNDLRSNRNSVMSLFNSLCRNEQFLRQFVDAYCLIDGSVFTKERLDVVADSVIKLVAPALANENLSPNKSAARVYNIINTRSDRMKYMHNYFNLGEHVDFSFSSNVPDATIMLNNVIVPTGRFKGRLYTPFELIASAPQGYRFVGWKTSGQTLKSAVISRNSQWKYYDGGSLDGTGWEQSSYDDTTWKKGATPIGYSTKRNDCTTITASYLPTYYFRTDCTLNADLKDISGIELQCTVDDGFVIYVNGVEAYRYLMPKGKVEYSTMATTYTSGDPDQVTVSLDKNLFHEGVNTLAVEVHNNILNSSDIHWNASLSLVSINSSLLSSDRRFVVSDGAVTSVEAVFEKKAELIGVPLYINEVSAANEIFVSDHFKKDDWFEIYNQTDEDIDIAGMYLSDKTNNWQKYCVPSSDDYNTIVPAHGSLVVWADGRTALNQLHVPFKLSNSDGSQVSITAADGSWSNTLQYLEHDAFSTFGRYPDAGPSLFLMTRPTINKPNYLTTSDFDFFNTGYGDGTSTTLLLALNKGWNWVSHNMADAVLLDIFKPNTSTIRGQYAETSMSESASWQGVLTSLQPSLGYKMLAVAECEVPIEGYSYPVDERPVNLNSGWNWIGAPMAASTSLALALQNYTPSEGDQIVGQDGFALYENGMWQGSLEALTPGSAYMMKTDKAKRFIWNVLTRHKAYRRSVPPVSAVSECPWQPDAHAYPEVMNFVLEVQADGNSDDTDGLIVGAFCDDECRGVTRINNGIAYLTVYGLDEEHISFRILDVKGDEYKADKTLSFQPLLLMGSHANPYVLTIDLHTDISVHPASNRMVDISYFSLDGKRISRPHRGVCLQRMVYQDGRVTTRKFVLEQ